MDDKMKAAFLAWHDSVTYIGPEDIVEWALDYLRSQQEPAAGEEIMVNAAHDVYTLPLQPSGLASGPRFVVHVPGPVKTPIDNQEPLGEEFQRVLDEHSWDLYVKTAEPVGQHPDDAAVDAFAAVMKAKLAKKRSEGRGGWQECSAEYLSDLLRSHVEKGDPVDVANFCMFLHQRGESILPQPAEQRGQPKRRPYNASGSLSEYGVFPECDAQQPAEGEEIMVNTPYDVFILPLQPSGLDGNGPRFVVHVPGPEQPAAPSAPVGVGDIIDAFDEIAGLCRHLRQGGPAPEDLQDLSAALDEAVDIAANMLHALVQQPAAVDEGSRIVTRQLLHWGGIPVHVTGTVTTSPGNWSLIDAITGEHNG